MRMKTDQLQFCAYNNLWHRGFKATRTNSYKWDKHDPEKKTAYLHEASLHKWIRQDE